MAKNLVRERLLMDGPRALSDVELLTMLGAGGAASRAVPELAWLTVAELRRLGVGEARAAALVAAFELGRRGAWAPPKRGERCLDPGRVCELMRPLAHAPRSSTSSSSMCAGGSSGPSAWRRARSRSAR
jgi:DNA repair protein RadC